MVLCLQQSGMSMQHISEYSVAQLVSRFGINGMTPTGAVEVADLLQGPSLSNCLVVRLLGTGHLIGSDLLQPSACIQLLDGIDHFWIGASPLASGLSDWGAPCWAVGVKGIMLCHPRAVMNGVSALQGMVLAHDPAGCILAVADRGCTATVGRHFTCSTKLPFHSIRTATKLLLPYLVHTLIQQEQVQAALQLLLDPMHQPQLSSTLELALYFAMEPHACGSQLHLTRPAAPAKGSTAGGSAYSQYERQNQLSAKNIDSAAAEGQGPEASVLDSALEGSLFIAANVAQPIVATIAKQPAAVVVQRVIELIRRLQVPLALVVAQCARKLDPDQHWHKLFQAVGELHTIPNRSNLLLQLISDALRCRGTASGTGPPLPRQKRCEVSSAVPAYHSGISLGSARVLTSVCTVL